jgi:hypothetical protein
MALVGNIAIAAGVDLGGLTKGMKLAGDVAGNFASRVTSGFRSVIASGAGLASLGIAGFATLAGASLAGFTSEAEKSIADNADLAERIGATTEGLVGLQHGAKLASVDTEMLNKGLQKMQINMSNAAIATKAVNEESATAAAAFKRLGIDPKKWKGEDAVETFREIAGKIAALENPADRGAAAMAVFGKAGVQMGNLLIQGSAGVDAAIDEAKRLGITYTNEQASMVEQAGDAKDKLGTIFQAIGNQFVIAIAPGIEAFANSLTDIWAYVVAWSGDVKAAFETFSAETDAVLKSWGVDVGAIMEGVGIVFRNLPEFIAIAGIKIQEFVINASEYLGTLPANLAIIGTYIRDNWSQLIIDGLNIVATGFQNLGKIAYAIYAFLKDPTGGFNFQWTALTDGFEASAAQLPELIKPQLTSLQSEIDSHLATINEQELARAAQGAAAVKKTVTDEAKKPKSNKKEKQFAEAVEFGSAEAFQHVLEFRGVGGKGTAQEDTAKATQESVEIQKQILATLQQQSGDGGGDDLETLPY